ncbi:MAG: hypothetical protein ACLQGP_34325 [Isosphaeraceae bacterium]
MSNPSEYSRNRRRYCPTAADTSEGAYVLEHRILLNGGKVTVAGHGHAAARPRPDAAPEAHRAKGSHTARRLTPAQEINAQFAAFLTMLNTVVDAYVASLNEQSTNTVSVTTTVAAPYAAGSPTIQVADASVFGTEGTFSQPVTATASVGNVTIGQFSLIGSSANQVIVNLAASSSIPMNTGTVLTATIPANAQSSAATIFPNYIQPSTLQLAVTLDRYFNNLPIPLPNKVTLSHEPQQQGAIQEFVYQVVAGSSPTSLQQMLKTVASTLPTTPGSDLQIFETTVATTVNEARLQTLNGVKQIFAGTWQVQPQNTSSSSTTSGTGSTTTSGRTA